MPDNGKRAEAHAGKWLKKRKLKIVELNFHSRFGEIDIIALDGNTICFIEVRYRKSLSYGTPADTVTAKKQLRIIKTAQAYLQRNTTHGQRPARFDIVSLSGNLDKPDIDWYKDAFMINTDS
jgi:putative endonuclease